MDRYRLYECCVQSPTLLVQHLTALHGRHPRRLGEDFCGTAAVSHAWTQQGPDHSAVATDLDAEVVARARARCNAGRVTVELADATTLHGSGDETELDVVFVGNFSIGEIHDRATLMRYLRGVRSRLGKDSIFVCDTYGGESAFRVGGVVRTHPGPDGTTIRYTWEQRTADAATARVVNALHFRVELGGEIIEQHTDAFVYRWRLWSVPELRDALHEAGFATTEVYEGLLGESEKRTERPLSASYVVCVVGRV